MSEDNDKFESSRSLNSTPEEIRDYVRQFKLDVEEKYVNSKVNMQYQINPGFKDSSLEGSSTLEMANLQRYFLNSQNIERKYGSNPKVSFDASLVAEMLLEIGQIDRDCLKELLKVKDCGISKAVVK